MDWNKHRRTMQHEQEKEKKVSDKEKVPEYQQKCHYQKEKKKGLKNLQGFPCFNYFLPEKLEEVPGCNPIFCFLILFFNDAYYYYYYYCYSRYEVLYCMYEF